MLIDMEPISVRTGSKDREGRLALFGGELVAVIVRLDDDVHGDNKGQWFIEALFGSNLRRYDPFPTLADAEAWLGQRIAK